jgi:hypothetical protein
MVKVREDTMMAQYTKENSNKESVMAMEKFSTQRLESGTKVNGVLMLDMAKVHSSQRIEPHIL